MDIENTLEALKIGLKYASVEGTASERLAILEAIHDIRPSDWVVDCIASCKVFVEQERKYWESHKN